LASLPPGSERLLDDRFAEKKSPWPKILMVVIIIALVLYVLHVTGIWTLMP
jgi:hypothetical protein